MRTILVEEWVNIPEGGMYELFSLTPQINNSYCDCKNKTD